MVQRARYPLRYETIVRAHARNYDLAPSLLAAVIYAESKFDAVGALGRGRGRAHAAPPGHRAGHRGPHRRQRFVVSDLVDPEINVRYGSWYLRHLLDRYDDDAHRARRLPRGPGNVDAWRRKGVGIQFPETRAYVDRVLDAQEVYADAYAEELGRP